MMNHRLHKSIYDEVHGLLNQLKYEKNRKKSSFTRSN